MDWNGRLSPAFELPDQIAVLAFGEKNLLPCGHRRIAQLSLDSLEMGESDQYMDTVK